MDTGIIPLDHYYLELRNNCYGVVVGNTHYRHLYVGYIKYCETSRETIWGRRGRFYERIVRIYDPEIVYSSTTSKQYIPYYGGLVPVIPLNMVTRFFNPVERVRELYYKPRDRLEEEALSLIHGLESSTGIHTGIGVTGSILINIHNPDLSDIDLVVYGWRSSVKVVECIMEKCIDVEGFSGERLRLWLRNNARLTGLTPREVLKYYRVWRRGVFGGREYSIIYNDGIPREFNGLDKWSSIGPVVIEAELTGGLDGLNYPSKTFIEKYRVIRGGDYSPITEVLSFEALYIPLLYEGGRAVIDGLLQYSESRGVYRVVVGVREYRGSIRWVR